MPPHTSQVLDSHMARKTTSRNEWQILQDFAGKVGGSSETLLATDQYNRNLQVNSWNSKCNQCLILHLEGSMNLNTVPVGDVALGYEVAIKYSSPEKAKSLSLLLKSAQLSAEHHHKPSKHAGPASSSAKEMMNLW